MKVISPYKPYEIIGILNEQIDRRPSFIRCLLSLNAHYFTGTSPVCGNVGESEFELRNRRGPYFSLRVKGILSESSSGTDIELNFSKPVLPDFMGLFVNRYNKDRQIVLNFLTDWIKITFSAEQGGCT